MDSLSSLLVLACWPVAFGWMGPGSTSKTCGAGCADCLKLFLILLPGPSCWMLVDRLVSSQGEHLNVRAIPLFVMYIGNSQLGI